MRTLALAAFLCLAGAAPGWSQTRQSILIRDHQQTLYLYGEQRGDPVIVSSGDGGWIHLAPAIAQMLARRGFFVVGFDSRAYLSGFTTSKSTLSVDEAPDDYKVVVQYTRAATGKKPILIGVSEGAGLSILAAANDQVKSEVAGVIALGAPDHTELGWRLRDSVIYLTHKIPNEPTFSTAEFSARVAPVPLAIMHSTGDEFVSLAAAQNIFDHAREPRRLWVIKGADHRFGGNMAEFEQRLAEAIAWIHDKVQR